MTLKKLANSGASNAPSGKQINDVPSTSDQFLTGTETNQFEEIVSEELITDDLAEIENRKTTQPDPTVIQIVADIRNILTEKLISAFEELGDYACTVIFDDRSSTILSHDPNNNELWSQVLRHPDMIVHRRMLWDALYAAAVKREWEENDQDFSSLTYLHRLELSKLSEMDTRFHFAKIAEAEKLSVKRLRAEITNYMKGINSKQRQNQKLLKQFSSTVDSMSKLQKMLKDKELLASLDQEELLNLLQQTNKSLKWAPEFPEYIRELERSIFEIVQERRKSLPEGETFESQE